MNRALLAKRVFDVPLLVDQHTAEAIVSALAEDFAVEPLLAQSELQALYRPNRETAIYHDKGGIAVVPIVGELAHRATPQSALSGVRGYNAIQNHLLEIADDPRVQAMLLDIDSGGGEVGGLSELADTIAELGNKMPVWAISNSLMASAAYWLGSSADRVIATPFARVGSIGVVAMHADLSKAAEKKGVVMTFVHAGKHKIDGNAFEPLSRAAKATMVSMVEEVYGQFTEHVAMTRRMSVQDVRDTEARVYSAKEALDVGLVDGISTLGKTIAGLQGAIEERRKAQIRGLTMKTYEDGLNEGRSQGLNEGRQAASSESQAQAQAAAQTAAQAAAKAERDRVRAITTSPEAKGREQLAEHLAYSTEMSPADAEAMLKVAPRIEAQKPGKTAKPSAADQTGAQILEHLRATSPEITHVESEDRASEPTARVNEIGANLKSYREAKAAARGNRVPYPT